VSSTNVVLTPKPCPVYTQLNMMLKHCGGGSSACLQHADAPVSRGGQDQLERAGSQAQRANHPAGAKAGGEGYGWWVHTVLCVSVGACV
jgi:hypothetical protein